jgi:3-oxoacyl-[acyl-carrier protein] reductase
LQGKTALVLGGGRGLGRGVAEALAAEGVDVALVSRDHAALTVAAREIATCHGVRAHAIAGDLADGASMDRAVDEAQARLGGRIDILLNNSGGPPPGGVVGLSSDVWLAQFQAMVLSIVRTTDRVLPGMRARRWGRVLTVTSTTVIEPNPALALSNSLRATLVGWSKTLATEVARDGITANLLLPGQISTDRTRFLDQAAAEREGVDAATITTRRAAAIPLGRYGTPEEFGALAAFLASERASYLTGGMYRVDGGALRSV